MYYLLKAFVTRFRVCKMNIHKENHFKVTLGSLALERIIFHFNLPKRMPNVWVRRMNELWSIILFGSNHKLNTYARIHYNHQLKYIRNVRYIEIQKSLNASFIQLNCNSHIFWLRSKSKCAVYVYRAFRENK